jgi:uncharacterized protein (TIGR02466 family)
METRHILGIPLYTFVCSNNLLDIAIAECNKLKYKKNVGNKVSVTEFFYNSELFDWFEECIDQAKQDIGIPPTVKLPIISCWCNKSTKLQNHHSHSHANSFMSAIFYLSDGHEGGDTVFHIPNPWYKDYGWMKFYDSQEIHIAQKVSPSKGKLILFPSWLEHNVTPLKSLEERISISFNTFFSGEIAADQKGKISLSLSTKTVRQRQSNET